MSNLSRLGRGILRSANVAGTLLLALSGSLPQAQELCPPRGNSTGVAAAVDERLELTLQDGAKLKIAGIDPVRPTPDNPEGDVKAREDVASWLLGRSVEFRPLEPGRDRWGRTVAQVFAPVPSTAGETRDSQLQSGPLLLVAEAILEAGLARYDPNVPNDPCRIALLAAEARARETALGLWADPYYAVLGAGEGSREHFMELAGSTVIVEGNVSGVQVQKPRITLHVGQRNGPDIPVTVVPRSSKAFEAAKSRLAGLSGQTVRARGLLDVRFGPRIEISSLDAVEVVSPEQAAAASAVPK